MVEENAEEKAVEGAVLKRKAIPEIMNLSGADASAFKAPPPEDIKIVVGDTTYPLPKIKLRQYKKLLKLMKDELDEDADELANIEQLQKFYYELLSPHYPEVTEEAMEDMPVFQFGAEFVVKLKLAIYSIPLDS